MSMNIYITAGRQATAKNRAGDTVSFTDKVKFDAYQTPTKVTYQILESTNPAITYIKWVRDTFRPETIDVYAPDDIFQEGTPIGQETIDVAEEHVTKFTTWLESVQEQGYLVEFSAI